MKDTKQILQQDLYRWVEELNEFKDRGFALADRVGALEMNISCPTVIETNETTPELLTFNTHELTDGDNLGNMSDKGNGETLVTFDPFGNYGIDPKLDLAPAENEAR